MVFTDTECFRSQKYEQLRSGVNVVLKHRSTDDYSEQLLKILEAHEGLIAQSSKDVPEEGLSYILLFVWS